MTMNVFDREGRCLGQLTCDYAESLQSQLRKNPGENAALSVLGIAFAANVNTAFGWTGCLIGDPSLLWRAYDNGIMEARPR